MDASAKYSGSGWKKDVAAQFVVSVVEVPLTAELRHFCRDGNLQLQVTRDKLKRAREEVARLETDEAQASAALTAAEQAESVHGNQRSKKTKTDA